MTNLGPLDLTKEADVERLATAVGARWTDSIVPLVAIIDERWRGVFFGYLFASPFGAMTQAVGLANAELIVKRLLEAARLVAEENKNKTVH